MRLNPSMLLAGLLAVLGGCSDDTSPNDGSRPASELNIVRLSSTSPALFNAEQSFYAVQGQDREVRISFQDALGGEGEEYLRLRVRPNSLLARPDGSAIAAGDSVLITVRVVDPAEFLFEMEPAGLTFNPSEPAELKIHYNHADHDFNDDGSVNTSDDQIKTQLAIWRQENLLDPFERLGSVNEVTLEEINVDIVGFTRYAIAY
ncbi:MAG TPA: hypothetical protein VIM84_15825 [Gemmatimonadales bacterium]